MNLEIIDYLKIIGIVYVIIGFIIFIYGMFERMFEHDYDDELPTFFEVERTFLFCVFLAVGYIIYLILKEIVLFIFKKLKSFKT